MPAAYGDVDLGVSGSIRRLRKIGEEGSWYEPPGPDPPTAVLAVAAEEAAAVGLLGDGAFGGLVSDSPWR